MQEDVSAARLLPYVSNIALQWDPDLTPPSSRSVDGTLAFVDISGFTRLTEMLSANGKAGAEELTTLLDATFIELLAIARRHGAELVKWGGDAVLLLFTGPQHPAHAVAAAGRMQQAMRTIGRLRTSVGTCRLRMSVGIHSGSFDFYLVGTRHRELVLTGPSAALTARLEGTAEAGQVLVSRDTAGLLPGDVLGEAKGEGVLVTAVPRTDVVSETVPADDADPRPLISRALAEHLGTGSVDSEHRQVAVAFIEFSGVQAVHRAGGAEALAAALHDLVSLVQERCEHHQVTFWETDIGGDGGKIMLVAGAPTSSGDDVGALLCVVREVVDAAGRLSLRAGVNSGRVFAGDFGPANRRTFTVKGDAVNLAARLMARAGTGEIYVADAALERSRVPFAAAPLEPFLVKGKTKPVRAHQLLAATAGAGDPLGRPTSRPPLAGRERELAHLGGLLTSARHGSGACVEIVGPPGIGKSRLVEEVTAQAQGWTVLTTRCDAYREGIPYAPLRDLVRQALGAADDTGAAETGTLLTETVQRIAPALAPWLPLLGLVVGADVPPTEAVEHLDQRFRRPRLEAVTTEFLHALLARPTLVVVDESHLMDEASSSLLRRLAAEVDRTPWLVMLARRADGPTPPLADDGLAGRLDLEPLAADAVARLTQDATHEHPLPPHERAALVQRSGGNPLFLLELLAAARSSSTEGLPDTVEGVLAAQIDALAPADRRLLRAASVLGVEVSLTVLQEMLDEPLTPARIAALQGFLEPDRPGTVRFRHNLVREAAYESLPFTRRRALHATAGHVLRRGAGSDDGEIAPLLALHFEQAGDTAAAWRYARLGGRRAAAVYGHVDAAQLYSRALRAGRAVRDLPGSELLEVAEALGDSRTHLGDFDGAEAAYRQAAGWAVHGLDRARLGYKSALAVERRGEYRRCLRRLTVAERLLDVDSNDAAPTGADANGAAPTGHDPSESDRSAAGRRLRAEIRAQYGLVRHRQGKGLDAVRLLREAVALAERADPEVLVTALLHLDIAELTLGLPSEGEHVRRAVQVLEHVGGLPWLEARALNQLGIRAYFAGHWEEAVRHYSASREACERAGDQWTAAVEAGNIAEVLGDQGHLAEAQVALDEALHTFRAAGTSGFVADGTRLLGRLAARQGDLDRAEELLGAARSIFADDGQRLQSALTDAMLAEARLLCDDPSTALDRAVAALEQAATLPGRGMVLPLLHRVAGIARIRLGDVDAGLRHLQASIEESRERNAAYELALSLRARAEVPDRAAPEAAAEADEIAARLGLVAGAGLRAVVPAPRTALDLAPATTVHTT